MTVRLGAELSIACKASRSSGFTERAVLLLDGHNAGREPSAVFWWLPLARVKVGFLAPVHGWIGNRQIVYVPGEGLELRFRKAGIICFRQRDNVLDIRGCGSIRPGYQIMCRYTVCTPARRTWAVRR